jgi:hypothetical protein
MMRESNKVNAKNLKSLAWGRGFRGVGGLAAKIGKHRTSLYRAVRNPKRFHKTYKLLQKELL